MILFSSPPTGPTRRSWAANNPANAAGTVSLQGDGRAAAGGPAGRQAAGRLGVRAGGGRAGRRVHGRSDWRTGGRTDGRSREGAGGRRVGRAEERSRRGQREVVWSGARPHTRPSLTPSSSRQKLTPPMEKPGGIMNRKLPEHSFLGLPPMKAINASHCF